ncbi:MAG: hypothetical protein ACRDRN_00775 [Sciscionella sp.]
MSVPSQRLPPRAQRPDGYTEWGSFAQPRQRLPPAPDPGGRHERPEPGRRRRRPSARRLLLGTTLLLAALAALVTGLGWPGWLVTRQPVTTREGAPPGSAAGHAGIPGAAAVADRLVVAFAHRDATKLDTLTCRTGAAVKRVEQRLLRATDLHVRKSAPVDTTASSMALVNLTVTTGGNTAHYTGVLAHLDNRWCVVALNPDKKPDTLNLTRTAPS